MNPVDRQYQAIHPHRLIIDGDTSMYLRLADLSDAEELYRLIHANRTHLSKHQAWAKHVDFMSLDQSIQAAVGQVKADRWLQYRIMVLDQISHTQRMIGTITLYDRAVLERTAKLSCWLAPAEEGKGYAERAVRRLLQYAFGEWNVDTVSMQIREGNAWAEHLLASVGGQPSAQSVEGEVDGEPVQFKLWVVSR